MKNVIILASASPRRKELLKQVGIPYVVDPADVDESIRSGESPEVYAVRVALDKARVAARRAVKGIVLAADTIVVVDDSILGKPADAEDAARMLTQLSGREHEVITGVALINTDLGTEQTRAESTRVKFRNLTEQEVRSYVATGEPLDKAGSYAIQGKGALLVESITGCYFNVVGLPLSAVESMLQEHGVDLW
ncbi:MAG: Maf family protein [Nitrospirota bacterium]|nr:Maf family protein [Nitrospirota bacterium]